jgi:hypothetical protein
MSKERAESQQHNEEVKSPRDDVGGLKKFTVQDLFVLLVNLPLSNKVSDSAPTPASTPRLGK